MVYLVQHASVLEVHAAKAGLLAGLGHEHRVRAHAFAGEIVYYPAAVERSHVSLSVFTDSLRVVPEADSADIPKITRTMRQQTLKVDSFPEIMFVSREVAAIAGDTAARDGGTDSTAAQRHGGMPSMQRRRVRVTGNLTLVGRTRPVSVDMELTFAGDTLKAGGSFVVKQTDFGIKPYGKALGMVKVKDEVRFELHVVALPTPTTVGAR